ncbi:MAG: GTPase Era [Armatimonadetes bacterium]|nr:GTPase Era [Armatimonadota bacterium]
MTEALPDGFRSGFVAVIGRPNVGKSTLVNALVGSRLAPVSSVPQTTRRRLLGILSRPDGQAVFVDTPGLHEPRLRLGQVMVDDVDRAVLDADLVLCVVDCTREPGEEDQLAVGRATAYTGPKLLVVNKIDRAAKGTDFREEFAALPGFDRVYPTSALLRQGLGELTEAVFELLPEGPLYFPEDQLSDVYEKDLAAEMIREAALASLGQEVPHAVAVLVDEWKLRDNGMLYVAATLYVERDSQKGIVIGQGGRTLKRIGSVARVRLEGWLEQKVYLDIHVKVLKNWRRDDGALRLLGLLR